MVDERTPGSSKSPNERNGVNDNFSRSQLFQYRIVHMTTTIVANNRFTTICTLELRLSKNDSTIATSIVHSHIFDSIKKIDASAAIISLDQVRIIHSKDIPSGGEYKKSFKDCRTCNITKR